MIVKFKRNRAETKCDKCKKLTAAGGSIVGLGKRNTVVYTIDELFDEISNIYRVCVFHWNKNIKDQVICYDNNISLFQNEQLWFLRDVAIKDVGPDDASSEKMHSNTNAASSSSSSRADADIATNTMIFRWFSKRDKLHLTSLHPQVSQLVVFQKRAVTKNARAADANVLIKRTLPVTQLKDGNFRDFCYLTTPSDDTLVRMMSRILEFLCVAHSHGYVHLDIKPENIFISCDRLQKNVTRPVTHNKQKGKKNTYSSMFNASSLPDYDQQQLYDFCLADYDMLEKASFVSSRLLSRQGRYFLQGTDGFMSPLITKDGDDSANRVFPIFKQVAMACHVNMPFSSPVAHSTHQQWAQYFMKAKDSFKRNVWKLDLHSLALTVLDVMPDVTLATTQKMFPITLYMLQRLMFFRTEDFMSAEEALHSLKTHKPKK